MMPPKMTIDGEGNITLVYPKQEAADARAANEATAQARADQISEDTSHFDTVTTARVKAAAAAAISAVYENDTAVSSSEKSA